MATNNGTHDAQDRAVSLSGAAEKRLVRTGGSTRHLHYTIAVADTPRTRERDPISLALVIDRSGSMSGAKLETAKKAAMAVLDRLDQRDTASITVFDNVVDTVLAALPVTGENRDRARRELASIQARASTALHQGWLIGCRCIASNQPLGLQGRLGRCFLLTDGLANVGEKDPERIATEAAGIRANAGIGTSTFGIGSDYDEGLLGPMAVAGGGQFHHLRHEAEIGNTFAGELGEILNVAARRVRLELAVAGGAQLDMVSEYRPAASSDGGMSADIGDLMGGEERHVVIRVRTTPQSPESRVTVRARLHWIGDEGERATDWHDVLFTVADDHQCDGEPRERAVLHWVGLHHASRAQRLAMEAVRHGDQRAALAVLETAIRRLGRYAQGDAELEHALAGLKELESTIKDQRLTQSARREVQYSATLSSRGQRDHRGA